VLLFDASVTMMVIVFMPTAPGPHWRDCVFVSIALQLSIASRLP